MRWAIIVSSGLVAAVFVGAYSLHWYGTTLIFSNVVSGEQAERAQSFAMAVLNELSHANLTSNEYSVSITPGTRSQQLFIYGVKEEQDVERVREAIVVAKGAKGISEKVRVTFIEKEVWVTIGEGTSKVRGEENIIQVIDIK